MDLEAFLKPNYSSGKAPREQTAMGNYIATFRKPTAVTHSCYGNFTGEGDQNLVICKGCLVSVYRWTENRLEHLRDFPMYGKVVFMELSSVHPLKKQRLFIATQFNKLCVFDWNAYISNVISVHTMIFKPLELPYAIEGGEPYPYNDYIQGGSISSNGTTIVLFHKQDVVKIIDIVPSSEAKIRFWISLNSTKLLDLQFLKNSDRPRTLASLHIGNDGNFYGGIYEIIDKDFVERKLLQLDVTIEPTFLISNVNSFLIIGNYGVIYLDDIESKTLFMGCINIQAYGRVDENLQRCRYLLGGHDGHLTEIELENNSDTRFSRLTFRPLGKTSIASSITYVRGDDVIFVGSCVADSQVLKMNAPNLQVLETLANSGPIIDFSLSNKPGGLRKLFMCCGTQENSSLECVKTGVGIKEKVSYYVPNIKNIWSLKKDSSSKYHTFLVFQRNEIPTTERHQKSVVYKIDYTGKIRVHGMDGFETEVITVCCHDAGNGQFIQVTEKSVRLIGFIDGQLRSEWSPPDTNTMILFASSTTEQVLLSTTENQLIYLEIIQRSLVELNVKENYDVACLDISPIGRDTSRSKLAVVAKWKDKSVQILSLPELNVLTTVELLDSDMPRCVLLCEFEQVPYLLCALYDESLLSFKVNLSCKVNEENSLLEDRKTKKLGGDFLSLRAFSCNGVSYVLLSREQVAPTLVFTKKKELQYNMLNLTYTQDMCIFHGPNISDGLAIVKENEVVVCTMGDTAGHSKIPMINYPRRICHQDESDSSVVLVEEKKEQQTEGFGRNLVQLIDKELKILSTFRLNDRERGRAVVSCSFAGDNNAYYCVGTSIDVPMLEKDNKVKGRILVFDERLNLIFQTATVGAVTYLKALYGGLLGILDTEWEYHHYYKWRLRDDGGGRELEETPGMDGVQFAGPEEVFTYTDSGIQRYEFHDIDNDIDPPSNRTNITAMHKLQDYSFLYSDKMYNINASDGLDALGQNPNKVGKWHSGEYVTQMKKGTLARMSDAHLL